MKRFLYVSFVIISMSIVSGCGVVKNENTTTSSLLTSIHSASTSISSSSIKIDKDDVSTWPRFEFKELGFSVQLPFEKNMWHSEYRKCYHGAWYDEKEQKTGQACDFGMDYSTVNAYVVSDSEEIPALSISSRSKNFSADRSLFATDMYDFYLSNKNKENLPHKTPYVWEIQNPLKFFYIQGNLVAISDLYKNFYEYAEKEYGQSNKRFVYGIYLKIPNNKEFQAAIIELGKIESNYHWTQKQVESIAGSIVYNVSDK